MRQGFQQDVWGLFSRLRGGGSGGWIFIGFFKVWFCVQIQIEDGLVFFWSGRFQGFRKFYNFVQYSVCVIGYEFGFRWVVFVSIRGGNRFICGFILGLQMFDFGRRVGFKFDQVCLLWWFKKQELLIKLVIEVLFFFVLVQWVEVLGIFLFGYRVGEFRKDNWDIFFLLVIFEREDLGC